MQAWFQEPPSSPDLNTRVHVVVDVVVFQHTVSVVIEIDTDLQRNTHTHTHKKTNKQTHNYGSRESVHNKMRRWQGGEDAAKQSELKTAAGNDPPTQNSTTAVCFPTMPLAGLSS